MQEFIMPQQIAITNNRKLSIHKEWQPNSVSLEFTWFVWIPNQYSLGKDDYVYLPYLNFIHEVLKNLKMAKAHGSSGGVRMDYAIIVISKNNENCGGGPVKMQPAEELIFSHIDLYVNKAVSRLQQLLKHNTPPKMWWQFSHYLHFGKIGDCVLTCLILYLNNQR